MTSIQMRTPHFRDCNAPPRSHGTLARTLDEWAARSMPRRWHVRIKFHRGRAHRYYPPTPVQPYDLRMRKLIVLNRRLHR